MARPFIQTYDIPSGRRYRAWYYDAAGRKKGLVFRTRREAEAFLREKAGEDANGTLVDTRAGQVTLETVWNERNARETFAPATVTLYEYFWSVVGPVLGHRPIADIRPSDVEAALARFESPASREKAREALVATFNYAIDSRRVAVNPAKAPRRSQTRSARMARKSRSSQDDQRYLTDEHVGALIAAVPERYRALVELMARVGLRPGEAYALTVGQFDPERRTIRIDRTVDGSVTKTGEDRTVVLPKVVAESLVEQIQRFSNPEGALVFPNGNGGMLDRNSFRHVFQRAALKAGLNHGLSPNHLRHTAAAFAIAHGANVYDVQKMLGHAKPSITLDVYGHLWDDSSERLAERLDAAIRESRFEEVLDATSA